jgi:hypothetical protein
MNRRNSISTTAGVVAVVSTAMLNTALAQNLTTEQYRRPQTEKDLVFNKAYLMGATDGLLAANALTDDKLFCLPGDIAVLSFEQANDAMMSWVRKKGLDAGHTPTARALPYGLQQKYSCSGSTR